MLFCLAGNGDEQCPLESDTAGQGKPLLLSLMSRNQKLGCRILENEEAKVLHSFKNELIKAESVSSSKHFFLECEPEGLTILFSDKLCPETSIYLSLGLLRNISSSFSMILLFGVK